MFHTILKVISRTIHSEPYHFLLQTVILIYFLFSITVNIVFSHINTSLYQTRLLPPSYRTFIQQTPDISSEMYKLKTILFSIVSKTFLINLFLPILLIALPIFYFLLSCISLIQYKWYPKRFTPGPILGFLLHVIVDIPILLYFIHLYRNLTF